MKNILQISVIFVWTAFALGYCPNNRTIEPCRCISTKNGISARCKGPEDIYRIFQVLRNFTNSGTFDLVLESLTLPVLPASVRNVSSLRLYDVHVRKLQASSTSVWSRLNEIVIESSSISENLWPQLKGAKYLQHLKVSNMEIPVIGSEFKQSVPDGVAYLDIRKTKTFLVESQSMSHLKSLKYFLLVDVPLSEFPRSALPQEMPHLHTFILGNTEVEKLEKGFFEGMPKLEVLMLNGNKLKTLDSLLFVTVQNHLNHLLAERNPLICNCNLLWLTKNAQIKGSIKVMATCTDTATHERKEVISLNEHEYCM